jgi:hypothetical protein
MLEKRAFSTNGAEKTGYPHVEARPISLALYKTKFKMDQRSKC